MRPLSDGRAREMPLQGNKVGASVVFTVASVSTGSSIFPWPRCFVAGRLEVLSVCSSPCDRLLMVLLQLLSELSESMSYDFHGVGDPDAPSVNILPAISAET